MNHTKICATAMIVLIALLAACDKPKPKTGYEVRMSDGWASTYEYCHAYEKAGKNIKCFGADGALKVELFMTDEIRFYIRKQGE